MKNRLGKPFGPPPKRGPNPQVPPVKLQEGGLKKSGFKIEMPEPSPEYKKIKEQREKYDD